MLKHEEIERSIITKFRKDIWREFIKAVRDYQLVKENDKIAVCISGGKDSMLLAKCLEELQRHGKVKFELVYLVMNPGYKDDILKQIKKNAEILNLPIEIFNSDVFDVSLKLNNEKPCYMCARMRRGFLYSKASELGCNKIALGHHFDDVIETIMLSVLYGGEFKSMLPKLHSSNFSNMELIRPLYLVRERNIIKWAKSNKLSFINCACKFTEKNNNSKRLEIKKMINSWEKENSLIPYNIFSATKNVNLKTILGYKEDDKVTDFLDNY